MTFDVNLNNKNYKYWRIPKNVLHPIDDTVFPFDTSWKRVAVNVSGGADSACGTATLCSIIEKTKADTELFVISNVRVWDNRPWAAPISLEVFNKLQFMFPNIKMTRVENFIPPEIEDGAIGKIPQLDTSGDRICTNSFNKYIQHRYSLDAVYGFITNNPIDDNFKHRQEPWDRRWSWDKVVKELSCPTYHVLGNGQQVVLPWRLLSKDFVIGQYYKNNWEDLLAITRSCEGDKIILPQFEDYTTYKHGESPLVECLDLTDDLEKGCYWCAERKWAIETAKKKLKIK